jgi:hypothetical protein
MRLWGVEDWNVEKFGNAARVSYMKNGRTIDLNMDKQGRPQDNLRVLYLAIHSLRLNEVRGIGDVVASAYLQIGAGKQKRNPYDVLMINEAAPLEVAVAVFKNLAMKHHPDRGGNVEQFRELNEAIEEIRKQKKGR